jgi:hypothetical protein
MIDESDDIVDVREFGSDVLCGVVGVASCDINDGDTGATAGERVGVDAEGLFVTIPVIGVVGVDLFEPFCPNNLD